MKANTSSGNVYHPRWLMVCNWCTLLHFSIILAWSAWPAFTGDHLNVSNCTFMLMIQLYFYIKSSSLSSISRWYISWLNKAVVKILQVMSEPSRHACCRSDKYCGPLFSNILPLHTVNRWLFCLKLYLHNSSYYCNVLNPILSHYVPISLWDSLKFHLIPSYVKYLSWDKCSLV